MASTVDGNRFVIGWKKRGQFKFNLLGLGAALQCRSYPSSSQLWHQHMELEGYFEEQFKEDRGSLIKGIEGCCWTARAKFLEASGP